ncbi:STAS domain-containing protein [Streptomyces sp. NPDC048361]|uniref:STAS domain-containing protein n=1 Tax=Streptomyces sp. NPDC048361 TaxID=3154720 RepID=UPI003439D2D3
MGCPSGADGFPADPSRAATLRINNSPGESGLEAIGEISLTTRDVWRQALEQLLEQRANVLHVDLSRVGFVDVAGVTDLAVAAQRLPAGHRIVLHGPPARLPRILALFWPELSTIEMAAS